MLSFRILNGARWVVSGEPINSAGAERVPHYKISHPTTYILRIG